MIYITLDFVGLTQSSVIMDHSPQCWSEVFFLFTYMFVIIFRSSYIYVLHNHIIANCLQSVPVKIFFLIG